MTDIRVLLCLLLLFGWGCLWIKTEPVHVTVDVNLRVQKELAQFFDDVDEADPTMETE